MRSYLSLAAMRKRGKWSLLAQSGQPNRTCVCPLSDHSGQRWILACDGLSAYDPKRTRSVRRSTHLAPVKAESAVVHAVANIIQRLKRYNQSICAVIVKSFLSIGFTGAKFSSFIKPHNSLRCRTRNFDKFPFCLKQVVTRRLAL